MSEYSQKPNTSYSNKRFNTKKEEPFDENNVKLYKAYYATGNRDVPETVLIQLRQLAKELDDLGYTLRHGSMDGIEVAMEEHCKDKELHVPFLPWKEFTKEQVVSYFNTDYMKALAKMFHPTWDGLKPAIQAFLSKNIRCLLGKELKSPVRFVLIWSEDGAEKTSEKTNKTGNMAHIISVAAAMKIPVFNFGKPNTETRFKNFLGLNND